MSLEGRPRAKVYRHARHCAHHLYTLPRVFKRRSLPWHLQLTATASASRLSKGASNVLFHRDMSITDESDNADSRRLRHAIRRVVHALKHLLHSHHGGHFHGPGPVQPAPPPAPTPDTPDTPDTPAPEPTTPDTPAPDPAPSNPAAPACAPAAAA
ncbi:hypothetical protein PC9H_006895 [Pleurotus ostreatus]|uniref:Uncharacterized protein n=1 Tax=Pleurotus ostreatus TaxID=5322 RepID=A0A8H7DRX5_PLEOS|nr:uncharacterized protein PC9H_006895 [Pleurotus ostreatus]KAF7431175.1 hypothetical protein PC9H_006895 [Pleurotus ostreatus]